MTSLPELHVAQYTPLVHNIKSSLPPRWLLTAEQDLGSRPHTLTELKPTLYQQMSKEPLSGEQTQQDKLKGTMSSAQS